MMKGGALNDAPGFERLLDLKFTLNIACALNLEQIEAHI